MIEKEIVDKVKEVSRLTDLIPNLKKAGKNFYTKCPNCGKDGKGKGLIVNPTGNFAKCYSCDYHIQDAVDYLIKTEKYEFVDAVMKLANDNSIDTESTADKKKRLKRENKKGEESFCDKQLKESGLEIKDVHVTIQEDSKEVTKPAFVKGTRDQYGRILPNTGNDMLIYYYDLDGKPTQYKDKKSGRFYPLIRVRWQNPDLHRDKDDKPIKYQSPAGSGSHLYIPQKIRTMYKYKRPIHRLFIQEGEKKAEKCCKHDIMSVGIMGIQNLGSNNQLPQDLQLIIQGCSVKEVVFLMDSDWNHLSGNLKPGDAVDQRPRSFFYAVKNYKEYMRTLVNLGISVEIFFGHVKENEKKDKGVDDLLTNTLYGKESSLIEDIKTAVHTKTGEGEYIQIHKITQIPDNKIADLWLLNDAAKFAQLHLAQLKELKEFKIGKLLRRFNDDGILELAQPLMDNEQYWEEELRETKDGNTKKTLSFNYYKCFAFLTHRGYCRVELKSGTWDFCHIENKIVHKVDQYQIRDYVTEFTKEIKKIDVLNMLYRGGPQYLGYEKLSNIDKIRPAFEKATKDSQCLFFKDKFWEISANGIIEKDYNQLPNYVWNDKIIPFSPVLVNEDMVKVQKLTPADITKLCKTQQREIDIDPDKSFSLEFSKVAGKCDFLQFLINASDFYWKKDDKALEELFENNRHVLNKLTAIGYLLHDYKNESELKAVIAMDGKISEVGSSNGRSGKSLLGRSIEYVIPQLYIGAKNKKLTEDQFIFGEITEKTKNLFLDDVRANVDFEFFFPLITGKQRINPKGGQPFTLSAEDTPKLLITTNHAINGEGSSFKDRQAFVAFSDFYNDRHKPVDDFGCNFFSEWEKEQWNLFYNLMATCLMLYFKSLQKGWAGRNAGIVPPPMESLEKRQLRQMMGEIFFNWAESYFTDGKLNTRLVRKELQDEFWAYDMNAKKYYSSTKFAKALRCYCEYTGLHLNPTRPDALGNMFPDWIRSRPGRTFFGELDKSGGKEYFTVADEQYTGIID